LYVDEASGTSWDTSFDSTVLVLPPSTLLATIVSIGTIVACPINSMKSPIFPRPIARNPMKLINKRGRALKAESNVKRISDSTGIPIDM
jgi:hypothetical protein